MLKLYLIFLINRAKWYESFFNSSLFCDDLACHYLLSSRRNDSMPERLAIVDCKLIFGTWKVDR
jgi:hypothetical protein